MFKPLVRAALIVSILTDTALAQTPPPPPPPPTIKLPTEKEQCYSGGWQAFKIFKNQGDCVSYVATKGKNPPAGK